MESGTKPLKLDNETVDFPWYDSLWLTAYSEARGIIRDVAPAKLSVFEDALRVFTVPPDFEVPVIDKLLMPAQLESVRAVISGLAQNELEDHELFRFGRFILHNHPAFTAMQNDLTALVSDLAGEPLESSYNFLSLYNNLGVCKVHLDAPLAKWTLDICIDQSGPWPICFSQPIAWPLSFKAEQEDWHRQIITDARLDFQSYSLSSNQALLFSGTNQWHYRERIPRSEHSNFCHLLFMHYIPAGTSELINPLNWHRLFDVPELAGIEFHWSLAEREHV